MAKPPVRPGVPASRPVPTSKGGQGRRNIASAKQVSTTEAAALLGVDPTTIRAWRDQGCPGVKPGGSCNVAEISKWDAERLAEQAKAEVLAKAGADPDAMGIDEIKRQREMIGLLEDQRAFAIGDQRFINVEVVDANTGRMLGRMAAELLTLSSRVETDYEMARTPVERRQVIDDACKAIIVQMRVDHIINGDPGHDLEGMADEDVDALFAPTPEEKKELDKLDDAIAAERARAERTDFQ